MRRLARRSLLAGLAPALGGCSLWDLAFADTKPPLPGERIAVLPREAAAEPDPSLADLPVELPPPVQNAAWPVPGGRPNNVPGHVAAADTLGVAWRTSVGTGASSRRRLLAPPVIAEGRVFAADATGDVAAVDLRDGRTLWRRSVRGEGTRGNLLGVGVAYGEGRVHVASGLAEVVTLAAADGAELWRSPLPAPSRGAVTVAEGRVIVLTVEGEVVAFDPATGERRWVHRGPAEATTLLGAPAPAVDEGLVLVGFPNGDAAALRLDSGRPLWTEGLGAARGRPSIADIAAIRGRPAIDRGRGFLASSGGVTMALDMRSGRRVWERAIAAREGPCVAGDWVFLLSAEEVLVALRRGDGRVKWAAELPRWRDPQRRRDPIVWTGPLLAGDRLIVAGSLGEALALSPYTGEVLGRQRLGGACSVPPVAADGTVVFLTDDATVIALR
ncbi:MAG: PQQ-binding-like beta-propeller repeat protein [Acetobacteraceae bacterium]|nr:PQQ-binding-like beta-propeller repeat protein [Acetobacteraceae bacterium]